MQNMLTCPFCGKQPELDSYERQHVEYWTVVCLNDDCLVDVETIDFDVKEDAIAAWNKRGSLRLVK
ncbi:MAG: Lar family restriction alleviation protein [Candidatus Electrothrix sp. GW3-4]|uniref:Lar family restriction alleviation protein n=1 Tax=Candidatus Electrothrix sp. GW3-4 TaxID=3126740 RepID=UPI0030D544AF